MIIDPDFLDHWRTRMLVDALGEDELAPFYLIRLWAHCQNRKSDRFEMPAAGLKAQCRYKGDAAGFELAMTEAGFVKRDGLDLVVCGWAEQNASLLAAWENGNKGGRPRKEPKQNPRVTETEPMDNPAVTQGKPSANPDLTQTKPIRVDKSREEEKEEKPKDRRVAALTTGQLQADGLSEETADEWLAHRKRKGSPLTPRAWASLKAEVSKAGWTLEDAVQKALGRGWTGIEAEWLRNQQRPQSRDPPRESIHEKRARTMSVLTGSHDQPDDPFTIEVPAHAVG